MHIYLQQHTMYVDTRTNIYTRQRLKYEIGNSTVYVNYDLDREQKSYI
jgi:hypothetical protein